MALLSTGKFGFLLAATGVAHFAAPDAFVDVTRYAFPADPEQAVQQNGGIETALGLGLMLKPTRKAATLGLLGYLGWLGYNVNKNR